MYTATATASIAMVSCSEELDIIYFLFFVTFDSSPEEIE